MKLFLAVVVFIVCVAGCLEAYALYKGVNGKGIGAAMTLFGAAISAVVTVAIMKHKERKREAETKRPRN